MAGAASLAVWERSFYNPQDSRARPYRNGCRTSRTTGATEGRAHPCSSRILRLVDGPSRCAPARNRLQLHPARLRSAAARGSALGQAACLPVLCDGLGFQPPAHTPQLPFHAFRKNYRATSWGRSRAFLADTRSPSRGGPAAVLSPFPSAPSYRTQISLPFARL